MSAPVIGPLIIASGLVVCSRPASTKPQFATGPQKCVVLGPVGELMNFMSADDIVVVGAAVRRDGAGDCGGATRMRPPWWATPYVGRNYFYFLVIVRHDLWCVTNNDSQIRRGRLGASCGALDASPVARDGTLAEGDP